jgi:hypothetical protein
MRLSEKSAQKALRMTAFNGEGKEGSRGVTSESSTLCVVFEPFVREMIKLFKDNRVEQLGLSQSGRRRLDWPSICAAASLIPQ